MAVSKFVALARQAAKLDKLTKATERLAARLMRASRPETVERLSREGQQLERRIRQESRVYAKAERAFIGPTKRERQRQRLPGMQPAGVSHKPTGYFVRGDTRGNGFLTIEIFIRAPNNEPRSDAEVRHVVRELAAGHRVPGWKVETVEYGRRKGIARRLREIERIQAALRAIDLTVVGEADL